MSVAFTVLTVSNCEGSNIFTLDVDAASGVFVGLGELDPHNERFRVCCAKFIDCVDGKERSREVEGAPKSDCDEYW